MIVFPCPCSKHRFEMPDDEAGGLVQCPSCKRLNDVPTLSDLDALADDGTLKFADDDAPRRGQDDPRRLRELHRVYGSSRTDRDGNEIDLRQSQDDLRRVGATEMPLASGRDAVAPGAPKYDPITGELVRPLDVKPAAPRQVLPLGSGAATPFAGAHAASNRKRSIAYATREADKLSVPTLHTLPVRLFEPINLMVMGFVAVAMLLLGLISVPLIGGLFLVAPIVLGGWGLMLAHYCNCVHDLGPGMQDELPRPLRDLEFGADIWHPFTRMAFTLFVCFGPAVLILANTQGGVRFVGAGVAAFCGMLMFPALALIFCASGHAANLRPDRVFGTILTLGPLYLWIVVLGALAVFFGFGSVAILTQFVVTAMTNADFAVGGIWGGATVVSVAAAVYTGHLAAWSLGVLYRREAERFPWYFEEHERTRVEDKRLQALARIEAARARGRFGNS